jgi:hypothetical protein
MEENKMILSDQALGAIMMCLQKGILTQTDITENLKNLLFYVDSTNSLHVENPPTFELPETAEANINEPEENVATTGSD